MGRAGDFIDVHVTRAQKVVALITGVIVLCTSIAAGVAWVNRSEASTAEAGSTPLSDGPGFEVEVLIRPVTVEDWQESITVNPGDAVVVRVEYDNTGSVQQDDVIIKSASPKGTSIIPGTGVLRTAKTPDGSPQGPRVEDAILTNGVNIGSFATNSNAFLIYQINAMPTPCAQGRIYATAITENGNKQDTAELIVRGENCG
ncbi:hypothetical protein G3I13_01960 [Streptomyces sp. SID6673]|nr:hypothetical protein [Streptomyces sp. SID11726]NDZ94927.1 hypothetical protein [Streptomyces sp. SID11726]NEB23086.1 hypothetical protein [Streptomyces sp. SID6673]